MNDNELAQHSTGYLFWQVSNLWQRKIKNVLDWAGITHVQYILLCGIKELETMDGEVTQVRLARYVQTDVMMTSKVLRTLEEKKMVKRANHKKDTRAKTLKLTPAALNILELAEKRVKLFEKNFFNLKEEEENRAKAFMLALLQTNNT